MILKHTSHDYNDELKSVQKQVVSMGKLVEEQLIRASKALLKGKLKLVDDVIETEQEINAMEIKIDELCAQIIARRQPAAIDLRRLLVAIKVITDLERIGDESEKIARFATKLIDEQTIHDFRKELIFFIKLTINILHDALSCYAQLDSERALVVADMDIDIDEEFDKLNRLLITHMMEDPRNIKSVLRIIWCARSLERIGDHAKNICEYTVYLVNGYDIRHQVPEIDEEEDEA